MANAKGNQEVKSNHAPASPFEYGSAPSELSRSSYFWGILWAFSLTALAGFGILRVVRNVELYYGLGLVEICVFAACILLGARLGSNIEVDGSSSKWKLQSLALFVGCLATSKIFSLSILDYSTQPGYTKLFAYAYIIIVAGPLAYVIGALRRLCSEESVLPRAQAVDSTIVFVLLISPLMYKILRPGELIIIFATLSGVLGLLLWRRRVTAVAVLLTIIPGMVVTDILPGRHLYIVQSPYADYQIKLSKDNATGDYIVNGYRQVTAGDLVLSQLLREALADSPGQRWGFYGGALFDFSAAHSANITWAERDPIAEAVVKSGIPGAANLSNIHRIPPRGLVRMGEGKWDALVLYPGGNAGMLPAEMTSVEFIIDIKQSLAMEGELVMIAKPQTVPGGKDQLFQSLRQVFGECSVIGVSSHKGAPNFYNCKRVGA